MNKVLKYSFVIFIINVLVALCVAVFRTGHDALLLFFESLWMVSGAIAVVGALMRGGASTGDDPIFQQEVNRTLEYSDEYQEADYQDMKQGFDLGSLILWISVALFVLSLFVCNWLFNEPVPNA